MPMPKQGKAQLICKETGIIAGLTIFERVFQLLDSKSEFTGFFQDGDVVKKGDIVGEIKGDIRVLLTGERTALNYLQRMSGIATTVSYTHLDVYKRQADSCTERGTRFERACFGCLSYSS